MQSLNFFEIAQNQFNDALPFVLYRKPNALVVKGVFQNNDTVYTSKELTESGFVFAPFDSKKQTVIFSIEHSKIIETNVVIKEKEHDSIDASDSAQDIRDLKRNSLDLEAKTFHIDLVSKAIKTIEKDGFKKIVVSRMETINLTEANSITLFKRLLAQYKTAFVYCWYHPKIGLWLGATPETLLNVTGNRFTTMALAGTQEYKGDENPEWKVKEVEEQQLVTNYLVSNLRSLVSGLKIGAVETLKAGNLLHLRTKISGIFNSNLKAIVNVLHPTPAVCGLPKTVAKQFILENENYNREFYTGFLGEINSKEKTARNTNGRNVENSVYASIKTVSNLYVNLRCMQLTDVKANVYVGGGITIGSIPEKEWEETVNKTETMKKVLF